MGTVALRPLRAGRARSPGRRLTERAAPRVRRAETLPTNATGSQTGGDRVPAQTLQVHLVELKPGGSDDGHTHLNEETFYILEGKGYDTHNGKRHDWEKDDYVVVPTDSVHRRFNGSKTERALALVVDAKATWVLLGMIRESRSKPLEDPERYEPAREWSELWTPGEADKKIVVKKSETKWENTPDGFVRIISSPDRTDVRTNSVDIYEQEIASMTARHWHMADEVVYVMSGDGESRQWDVEAEIGDRHVARIAKEPTRCKFGAGDLVYVPQNVVHQHVNTGREPLRVVVAQNRLFKLLGYDSVVYLERARLSGRDAMARSRAPSR